MFHLVYSPHWFYGKDLLIDLFSIMVLFLIGVVSFRFYRLQKKKNYLYFASAFFVLALSFLFKILTNFTIYYHFEEIERIGFIKITYHVMKTSDLLFSIGSFMYVFLGMLGLFILHEIYNQKHNKQNIFLVVYLLILLSYFSFSRYFIFHLTSLFLLIFISKDYMKNFLKRRNRFSRKLSLIFFILAVSQFLFIFMVAHDYFYVAAEMIQLVGYFMLLVVVIRIFKHGKKKQN